MPARTGFSIAGIGVALLDSSAGDGDFLGDGEDSGIGVFLGEADFAGDDALAFFAFFDLLSDVRFPPSAFAGEAFAFFFFEGVGVDSSSDSVFFFFFGFGFGVSPGFGVLVFFDVFAFADFAAAGDDFGLGVD